MKLSNRELLTNALETAFTALYEAREVRHAISHLAEDGCGDSDDMLEVLQNVLSEKEELALEAISAAQSAAQGVHEKSKPKKIKKAKKKLAR